MNMTKELQFDCIFPETSGLRMIDEEHYCFEMVLFDEKEDQDYWDIIGRIDVVLDRFGETMLHTRWEYDTDDPDEENFKDNHPSTEIINIMDKHCKYGRDRIYDARIMTRELARINKFETNEIRDVSFEDKYNPCIHFKLRGTGMNFTLFLRSDKRREESLQMRSSHHHFDIDLEMYGLKHWDFIREQLMSHKDIRLKVLNLKHA